MTFSIASPHLLVVDNGFFLFSINHSTYSVPGFSAGLIKLSSRNNSLGFRLLKKPGLWLQNITTKKPEDEMVEVSIKALEKAFGDRYNEMVGKEYTAEAIG